MVADTVLVLQVWHVADVPKNDKFQYTYFAHKINSFDTAPKKLLESDSRLRPDRYALEQGDLSKAGSEKSRSLSLFLDVYTCMHMIYLRFSVLPFALKISFSLSHSQLLYLKRKF